VDWSPDRMAVFELFTTHDYVAVTIFATLYILLGEYSFFIQKSAMPQIFFFILTVIALFCSLPLLKKPFDPSSIF